MNAILFERQFSERALNQPNAVQKVERYSHSVFGGPKAARINYTGGELDLWELIERLRCPVEIYSDLGDRTWWGFVAGIELKIGHVAIGLSIDSMYNRVAVAYNLVESADETAGDRQTTAWAENTDSSGMYGDRELLQTISGSTTAHAEAARDMILENKKYPIPGLTMSGQKTQTPTASLLCRGWFSTLDWVYYSAAAADLDTAAQAAAIAGAGQFINNVSYDNSGITTNAYRDGDGKAGYELMEILKMGASSYRRMLAKMDAARNLVIYQEPALTSTNWLIDKNGELRDRFDNPIRRETCPVGMYVRLKDVIPGSADISRLADPTLMFVDEAEYEVATDTLKFMPRDIQNPWEIGVAKDG